MVKLAFFLTIVFTTHYGFSQTSNESEQAKSHFVGGLGAGLIGHTEKTNSYFTIYSVLGKDYDVSPRFKYGFSTDAIKLTWVRYKEDRNLYDGNFDKARYFSISSDFQAHVRYVFSKPNVWDNYDTFFDLGIGYNLPYYFSAKVFDGPNKQREDYPNRYTDFYGYVKFYLLEPIKLPFSFRFEYHPYDIINPSKLPNIAPLRISIEYLLSEPY